MNREKEARSKTLGDVTVLWHGWLKKLGRFSRRWRRRYFVLVSKSDGTKEFRHFVQQKELAILLSATPKGLMSLSDTTGICCFLPVSPSATTTGKRPTMFSRVDAMESTAWSNESAQDQKFAVISPLHVNLLAFENGKDWASSSESQQGLSLLATLSAFYPTIEVLHSGWMSKKKERTVHGPKSIISLWKRHYFVFLASGDLLYFPDEQLSVLQGRVDVRHAPTVRVTGERVMEEVGGQKKKESLFKFAKLAAAFEKEPCLVWIATPPSKMFVLKIQDDHHDDHRQGHATTNAINNAISSIANRRMVNSASSSSAGGATSSAAPKELTPAARKWLSLLLKDHAVTKYTQLEQCVVQNKYERSSEILSAVRAGMPDELRGSLWRGFAGAVGLQRRAELKQLVRRASRSDENKSSSSSTTTSKVTIYDEMARPIRSDKSEDDMIFSRLSAVAIRETQLNLLNASLGTKSSENLDSCETKEDLGIMAASGTDDNTTTPESQVCSSGADNSDADSLTDHGESDNSLVQRNTLKQICKGKMGNYIYPSDSPTPEWEVFARRRLLIAFSRFNPYCHPCSWRVSCLLLAYMDEENAFWLMNALTDVLLPGYFHGHRPALQIDIAAFESILQTRAPTLFAHLKSIDFALDRLLERWFLSVFTSSLIPLPTVLRIWDIFFLQGVTVLFGAGIALLLQAEQLLFRAKTSDEAEDCLKTSERNCIDADALFAGAFNDDLTLSWMSEDMLERLRTTHRKRVLENVTQHVDHFNQKLVLLSQTQDVCSRYLISVTRFLTNLADETTLPASLVDNEPVSIGNGNNDEPSTSWAQTVLIDPDSMSSSLKAKDPDGVQQQRQEPDKEQDGDACALYDCFQQLSYQLQTASRNATELAQLLSERQAKWLAFSSQLASCPLSKVPNNSDLQSWLQQVKEGKISGAGKDFEQNPAWRRKRAIQQSAAAVPNPPCSSMAVNMALLSLHAQVSQQRQDHQASSLEQDWNSFTLINTNQKLLESAIFIDPENTNWISCLFNQRQDLQLSHPFLSEVFLYNLISALKAACCVCLECHRASLRYLWHACRWSDSPVVFDTGSKTQTPQTSSTATIAAAAAAANSSNSSWNWSPSNISSAAWTYDSTISAPEAPPQSMAQAIHDELMVWMDTTNTTTEDKTDRRQLEPWVHHYKDGQVVFRTACESILNSFTKFARLESSIKGWQLKERVAILEQDLRQELADLDTLIRGAAWLQC